MNLGFSAYPFSLAFNYYIYFFFDAERGNPKGAETTGQVALPGLVRACDEDKRMRDEAHFHQHTPVPVANDRVATPVCCLQPSKSKM